MVSLNIVAVARTLSPKKPVSAGKSVFFVQFYLHNFIPILKCQPPAFCKYYLVWMVSLFSHCLEDNVGSVDDCALSKWRNELLGILHLAQ